MLFFKKLSLLYLASHTFYFYIKKTLNKFIIIKLRTLFNLNKIITTIFKKN